jgi:glycosyltransferase involved in cell wall biosynthesis
VKIAEWIFPQYQARGGRALFVNNLSKSFALAGLHVLVLGDGDFFEESLIEENKLLRRVNIGIQNEKLFKLGPDSVHAMRRFLKELIEFEPDIIHYHNTNHASIVYLLSAIRKLPKRPRVVCSLHDMESVDALMTSDYAAEMISVTTYFVCPSQYIYREVIKNTQIEPSKVKIIILGVSDVDEISPEKDRTVNQCLVVASLEAHKGTSLVLAAWPMILKKFPDAFLIVAGDGKEKIFLEEFSKTLGIERTVHFTGWLERENLIPLFKTSWLCFVPSTIPEAFGLSAAEAQIAGVPVIASNIGGLSEIIEDDESGFLVPPGNVSILVRASELVLGDAEKHLTMSINAHKRAESLFNFNRTLAQYLELFKLENLT